jgi:hypothetical protein
MLSIPCYFLQSQSLTFTFFLDKNQQQLIKLAHTKMPFGKYEGKFLIDLPVLRSMV